MPIDPARHSTAALLVAGALLGCSPSTGAAPEGPIVSQQATFRVEIVAEGLEHPWGMAFLPDGDLLVTERPGRLRLITADGLDPTPIEGVPLVLARGQGGLLDVALHPDYAQNGWLYLSYAAPEPGGAATHVARARLGDGRLEDLEIIFRARPAIASAKQFGSRLVFDRRGDLFVTLGERGAPERAQSLASHPGSVVRLRDDGRIPEDNPFVDRADARPEIFSYGHRNPQGMAVHPETGAIWINEHGPRGGDEVNVIEPGANYGWPVITYGVSYGGLPIGEGTAKAGMVQPIHYWVPSIAPSGMVFYDGDAFPAWRGDLFVGALKDRLIVRLELDGTTVVGEERLLEDALGRIRDLEVGPDGFLYLLTDESDGVLARLEPAG